MGFLAIVAIVATIFGTIIYLLGLAASAIVGDILRGRSDYQKWQRIAKYSVMGGLLFSIFGALYFSTYPSDEFHLERFSMITLREPPKLAKVVAKRNNSIALHSGENCTYSRILVPRQDYVALLASISVDSRFVIATKRHTKIVNGVSHTYEEGGVPMSDLQNEVHDVAGFLPAKIDFLRLTDQTSGTHYAVIFLVDEKHIELSSCF